MARPKHSKRRKAAVAAGYRSAFEADIAKNLDERGIKYYFEAKTRKIHYNRPVRADYGR